MKTGINMLLWAADVTPAQYPLLEQIKAWGYDGVELPLFGGSDAQWADVGGRLRDLQLQATAVTVVTPQTNPISPDPAIRAAAIDALKTRIHWAALAGVQTLCGPLYSPVGCLTRDDGQRVTTGRTPDEIRRAVEVFQTIAPFAEAAGVVLAVEPLNRFETYFLNTSAQGLDLCQQVHHPAFTLLVDTFHTNIEERDVYTAFADNGPYLGHVHISENDRGIPGRGHVLWDQVFSALRACGYDGWLVIEAFGQLLPELAGATCIWRKMFPDEATLAREGLRFMYTRWRASGERP